MMALIYITLWETRKKFGRPFVKAPFPRELTVIGLEMSSNLIRETMGIQKRIKTEIRIERILPLPVN